MFVDYAVIRVKAGDGGNGIISFRREKHVPKGGPDGGNGGDGGSVLVLVDSNLTTLQDVKYRKSYKGKRGAHGSGSNKSGKSGEPAIFRVPPGTIIRDKDTGTLIADMTEVDETIVVAEGGKGGKGNAAFATATFQNPDESELGRKGEERTLEMELKLLADVGIVGYPNAGKSTLLSRISAARPKIADYPFTTLEPYLGIVAVEEYKSFLVADIPGLIEGAHEGKGLGDRFLKHIERTKIILYLIDCLDESPVETFEKLKHELASYTIDLTGKPFLVCLNKLDAAEDREKLSSLIIGESKPLQISAVTGEGVDELIYGLWNELQKLSD